MFVLASGAQDNKDLGYLFLSGDTMPYDQQKHGLLGMGIGFPTYFYFDSQTEDITPKSFKFSLDESVRNTTVLRYINTPMQSYLKSGAVVLTVSLAKEANDKWLGGRHFNINDIGSAMFGHALAATAAYFIRKHHRRRDFKEQKELREKLGFIDGIYSNITPITIKTKEDDN